MENRHQLFELLGYNSPNSYLLSVDYQNAKGKLCVPIGKTETGEVLIQDLYEIPHMLICGTVGSGKTSFIQTLVTSLIAQYSPAKIRFILYDSKASDYQVFSGDPHFLVPIITDKRYAIGAVRWLLLEASRRTKSFVEYGCRDFQSYNEKQEQTGKPGLPSLFFILDDNSVDDSDNELVEQLAILLRNGRITGIHIFVSTSTMTSKLVKAELLPYILCRAVFRVSSRRESLLVLDRIGAEKLQIPNELFFKNYGDPVKCESAYIPYEEIVRYFSSVPKGTVRYDDSIINDVIRFSGHSESTPSEEHDDTNDDLFEEAVETSLELGEVSTSILQRKLRVGYARAARIIDELEEAGFISATDGSKPRAVLITKQQWEGRVTYGGKVYPGSPSESKPQKKTDVIPDSRKNSVENTDKPTDIKSLSPSSPSNKFTFETVNLKVVPLRNVPAFFVSNVSIGITDNQVVIVRLNQDSIWGHSKDIRFFGNHLLGLTYKKATLFSKGNLRFIVKTDEKAPYDIPLDEEEPDGAKHDIPFGMLDAAKMKEFAERLANDVELEVKYL